MSRVRLVDASFDEKSGCATVVKTSPYGEFTDFAFVHDDDRDIANEFDGCTIAEMRCDTRIAQERAKSLRIRYETIDNIMSLIDFDDMPHYVLVSVYGTLERELLNAKKQYQEAREKHHRLKKMSYNVAKHLPQERRKIRERYESNKSE